MTLFWGRVECEAAVGSNVRSVPTPLGQGQNWNEICTCEHSWIFMDT